MEGGAGMTSQYGAYALRAGLARLHELMRIHASWRTGTHMHAQTDKYIILITFHGNNDSRTLLNVTLYVYCLVNFSLHYYFSSFDAADTALRIGGLLIAQCYIGLID